MTLNNNHISRIKRAVLYDVILPRTMRKDVEKRILESENLIRTCGGEVVSRVLQRRHHPGSKSFIGRSKMIEIVSHCIEKKANLIVINRSLKNSQIYNIQAYIEDRQINIQVWDRADLIFHLFSLNATTFQARLQIELAKINHLGPRIYGMGSELSNQGAGIGTRGVGETNTEIMKRHLADHKRRIHAKMKKLEGRRDLNRKRRKNRNFSLVTMVGYTNAGKSSLFKALTGKEVYIEDKLFATLDTTVDSLYLSDFPEKIILADTIGFIRDLPIELVAAFRSTLEEVRQAELLLHVIDIADPEAEEKMEIVESLVDKITVGEIPTLYVYNKVDNISQRAWPHLPYRPVGVSTKTGENLGELINRIREFFENRCYGSIKNGTRYKQ